MTTAVVVVLGIPYLLQYRIHPPTPAEGLIASDRRPVPISVADDAAQRASPRPRSKRLPPPQALDHREPGPGLGARTRALLYAARHRIVILIIL